MGWKAQKWDAVNATIRTQINNLNASTPLIAAMKEWHALADEETRREIERQVQAIMDTLRRRQGRTGFGPGQALEILGAMIAFEEKWRDRKCPERGWKYEREQSEIQLGVSAE